MFYKIATLLSAMNCVVSTAQHRAVQRTCE